MADRNPLNPKSTSGQAANPLARLFALLPSNNQSPMPPQTGGMTPWLPPYQQPGQPLLPFEYYIRRAQLSQQQSPQSAPPQSVAQQPSAALPPGGQGFGGVEPPSGSSPASYDPNTDPRYLPEHWRGAYNEWLFSNPLRER